jgi:AAA domain-containing protein/primase-like protein/bifunctional DNA primase/polymerase-like protein
MGEYLVSEFLNAKSESISDDLVMRVISGSDDAVADLRAQLLFNGYVPLPASEKGVYLENWSKLDDNGRQRGVQPDIEMIDSWTAKHPQWQSTSVRCGEVVAIDCDVLDKVVADKIRDEARRCFGKAFPTRVGRPPKFLMMCRTAEPFSKLYTDKYVQPDGGESRVEVLCNGQQFIAYGIHPKTGKPYEWFGGEPEKTPVADLPEVSRGQIVAFLRAAEEILSAQPNWTLDPKAARGNYETREREEPKHDYSGAPTDWAKLERALDTLTDVSDYETYYRIVAALHDGTDDRKRARALAFRWAAGYPDMFDPAGLQKKWDSFKRGSGVGLGTIFHLAREAEAQNPWFEDGEYEYAQGQDGGPLETSVASSYTMRGIQWLWLDRFAIGKLGLIGGLPDKGKGLISCDLIACVTANKALPCKEGHVPQGNVIWLTAEDDIEDTIIPRLTAAGADLDKVHIVRMMRDGGKRRMFSLVTDLEALRSKIEAVGDVVLVIIDPVSAYVASER